MPRIMKQFVVDIVYNNKLFTVQQLLDYVNQTAEGRGNNEKVISIIEQSNVKIQAVMKSYGLTVHNILQKNASPAGKAMADAALEHANEVLKVVG